jgi:hypothetical protein
LRIQVLEREEKKKEIGCGAQLCRMVEAAGFISNGK